jgi:hypothetical protein
LFCWWWWGRAASASGGGGDGCDGILIELFLFGWRKEGLRLPLLEKAGGIEVEEKSIIRIHVYIKYSNSLTFFSQNHKKTIKEERSPSSIAVSRI